MKYPKEYLEEIKLRLNQIDNIEVLGPVDSPLLKIKKNFRSRLLIRLKNQNLLNKLLKMLIYLFMKFVENQRL